MRDSLDLKMLLDRNAFDFLAQKDQPLLREPRAIYDTSRKLNKELLEKIHKDTKLSKAQISRVFDLALFSSIDRSDKSAELAFEGFLKKKLERLYSQLLFSKVREKYIEYEGQVLPVSYSLFAPKVSENSNQFDKILAFTLQQYRSVLQSHSK
jgi:4-alpha-glucanotransferase